LAERITAHYAGQCHSDEANTARSALQVPRYWD
jgi:hypothetical protein